MDDEILMSVKHGLFKSYLPHTLPTSDTKERPEFIVACYVNVRGVDAVKRAFYKIAIRMCPLNSRFGSPLQSITFGYTVSSFSVHACNPMFAQVISFENFKQLFCRLVIFTINGDARLNG